MSAGLTIWISYLFCMDNSYLYGFDFEISSVVSIIFLVIVFMISFVYGYSAQYLLLLITGILFLLIIMVRNFLILINWFLFSFH